MNRQTPKDLIHQFPLGHVSHLVDQAIDFPGDLA